MQSRLKTNQKKSSKKNVFRIIVLMKLYYEIYKAVNYLLKKPELIKQQLKQVNKTVMELKSTTSSSNEVSNVLLSYLR